MKPGAHVAAAIDLVALINDGWQKQSRAPADGVLSHYFKERRYIGSKDRGTVSALVYFVLRHGAAIEWRLERAGLAANPRTLVLAALLLGQKRTLVQMGDWLTGEEYSAPALSAHERLALSTFDGMTLLDDAMPLPVRGNFPDWMEAPLREALGDELIPALDALAEEAPVDLRANALKATRAEVMTALSEANFAPLLIPGTAHGIRLGKRGALFTLKAFRDGWFEMQDEGSQRACALVAAKAGDKVIDFCAGAGGKTLGIAAQMGNRGRILAWDASEKRLSQMPKRLARAGVNNVTLRVIASESDPFVKRHKQSADWVLVDAPCTGSGTWRRNPDLKWRTGRKDLTELVALQERILASAARLVKPGGALVYVTCSLFTAENAEQATRFVEKHPRFEQEREMRLWPHRDHTDGFYGAVFRHRAALTQGADKAG